MRRLLLAFVVFLVVAPAASASTVRIDRGELHYTGGRQEANAVSLDLGRASYAVGDTGASLTTTGAGCFAGDTHSASCLAIGLTGVRIDLGDGDDSFVATEAAVAKVACGPGADSVVVAEGSEVGPDCESVEFIAPAPVVVNPVDPDTPLVPPAVDAPVTIASAPVTVDAQGRVPVQVSCPESSAEGCAGRITLTLPTPTAMTLARRTVGRRVLGRSRRFKLAAGQTKVVPVRLSRRASRIIRGRGGTRQRVKVAVTVEVVTATGTEATVSTITVRLRHG